MSYKSHVIERFRALCAHVDGGVDQIADATGLSAESLKQVLAGTKLPNTGNPRGLGPRSIDLITVHYPDWLLGQPPSVRQDDCYPAAAAEPTAMYGLPSDEQILEQMGMLLARVPINMRAPFGAVLADWARAGGTGTSPTALIALLGAAVKRRSPS